MKSSLFVKASVATVIATALLLGNLTAGITTLPTVGPRPVVKRSASGSLIVFTPIIQPNINPDTQFYPHTGYVIYDSHGGLLKNVKNHFGAWDDTPTAISLPPGHYTVKTVSEFGVGFIVPVIIRSGRTTVVDLQHGNPGYAGT